MGSDCIMAIKGLNELQSSINSLDHKVDVGIENAMKMILRKSKPLVPVDTGKLKASGKVEKIPNGYRISYRALNKDTGYNYAPIQHDNLSFKHRVGQANYLAQPVQQNMNMIKAMVVGAIFK